MENIESIEEFYRRKFDALPENFSQEMGHFNLFKLEPYIEGQPTRIPYRRRDFYKIMLVKGNSKVHYADQVVEIKKQALSFSNPQIPYKWEHLDKIREGVYCIFDPQFFHQFGQFSHYEVFQPGGAHIFELDDTQFNEVKMIYDRIEAEFGSDYKYKFDAIRNEIFGLIHYGLKLTPVPETANQAKNASQRIFQLFVELLERQFPIDETHRMVNFRSASDYAEQLNVHVNHLNRAVKECSDKTTTAIISDRLIREARALLAQTSWNVAEISYALGFKEPSHFNNFFRKNTSISPTQFRNQNKS